MTMLVAVTGFGGIGRTPFRKDENETERFARGAFNAVYQDAIAGRPQIGIVTDMHDRHEKPELA